MRNGLGLCVLGLLCLSSSASGQEATALPPGILMFCDDPSVYLAVFSAVNHFNEKMSTGNKLALFQILTASKSEIGSDSVYSLQFTSRRSDCLVLGTKHWRECNYLPLNKEPIPCNATVYMTESGADTRQVDCVVEDSIIPERASCLGCPEEINEPSEDLKVSLLSSIYKYNSLSESTHLFTLNSLGHATREVLAGLRINLRYDMRRSTCAKAEHKDLSDLCVPDEENMEFANCNSSVDMAPWRHETPQVVQECEPGPMRMIFIRNRRPPGWSPLRNMLFQRAPPTTYSAKEESSEEDVTTTKSTSNVGTSAPDVVADSPFHCPSKPWKPFDPHSPVGPIAPTKETMGEAPTDPSAEGAFSDMDLLG